MQPIIRSEKLSQVHSDIRGPVYVEAMKMIAEGTPVLRLNTGNPATFGFTMPPSVRHGRWLLRFPRHARRPSGHSGVRNRQGHPGPYPR